MGREGVEAGAGRDRSIEREGEGICIPRKTKPPGLGFGLGATDGGCRDLRGSYQSGVERG